jgi:hypothetical protein
VNERIKELAEQATTEEHDGFRYFDKAKFAELIVKECIKICSDVEADTEMDLSDGALVCVAEIKEHFGVQE